MRARARDVMIDDILFLLLFCTLSVNLAVATSPSKEGEARERMCLRRDWIGGTPGASSPT